MLLKLIQALGCYFGLTPTCLHKQILFLLSLSKRILLDHPITDKTLISLLDSSKELIEECIHQTIILNKLTNLLKIPGFHQVNNFNCLANGALKQELPHQLTVS